MSFFNAGIDVEHQSEDAYKTPAGYTSIYTGVQRLADDYYFSNLQTGNIYQLLKIRRPRYEDLPPNSETTTIRYQHTGDPFSPTRLRLRSTCPFQDYHKESSKLLAWSPIPGHLTEWQQLRLMRYRRHKCS